MVAIVGPNGAGKSRLLGTIELALFAGRGELAQWLAPGHERLLIELVFEHAGRRYRVRRMYQGGTRGRQTVDFECKPAYENETQNVNGWVPLTREDAKATDQLIVETLGLSRATFCASAFLAQGDAGNFAEATPALRKAVLGEILDPHNLWPRLAKRASSDARETESVITMRQHDITIRQTNLERLPELERDVALYADAEQFARADLAAAEQTLEVAQQAVVANTAAAERSRTVEASHERALIARTRAIAELGTARSAATSLAVAEAKLAELEPQAARIPEVEQAFDEQKTLRAAADAADHSRRQELAHAAGLAETAARIAVEGEQLAAEHGRLAERHARLNASSADQQKCDRCEQVLGAEAREAALASMAAELNGIEAAITAKTVAYGEAVALAERARAAADAIVTPAVPEGDFAGELATLREAERWIASAAPLIEQWRAAAATVPELKQAVADRETELRAATEELAAAAAEAGDAAELDRQLSDAQQQVAAARKALEAAAYDLTRARQQLEQLGDVKQELTAFLLKRKENQELLDVLKLAERAFGRDGIPALIAENVIPQIETEANRILELMPTENGETFRFELRSQRALKTAEHLKETLDMLVHYSLGIRPYETFSGGEHGRQNFALRIALALLLTTRHGAESRVLVLDEIPYLDPLGEQQVVDVVMGLRDRFDKILVVSHSAMADAFETVIKVARDRDGVSYLAGAEATVEALA